MFKISSIKRFRRLIVEESASRKVELELEILPFGQAMELARKYQEAADKNDMNSIYQELTSVINKQLNAIIVTENDEETILHDTLDISDIDMSLLALIVRAITEPDQAEIDEVKKKQMQKPFYKIK